MFVCVCVCASVGVAVGVNTVNVKLSFVMLIQVQCKFTVAKVLVIFNLPIRPLARDVYQSFLLFLFFRADKTFSLRGPKSP